jgi:multiple sugar transport system substrate-binding protein
MRSPLDRFQTGIRLPKIALPLLLALALAACKGTWPEQVNLDRWRQHIPWIGAIQAEQEPSALTLELMAWPSSSEQDKVLQTQVDAFQQAHPDIRVTVTLAGDFTARLRERLETGKPPDVFLVDSARFPELAAGGALAPLGDRLPAPDDVYPVLRDAFAWNGVQYCLPRDFASLALIYDPARLADAAVAPPTTWAEFHAAAQSLTDTGRSLYSMVVSPDLSRWLPFLYQAGGQMVDPTTGMPTMDSQAALQALDFYTGLVGDGIAFQLPELKSSWAGESFGKGQVAMVIESNWIVPYLAAQFPGREFAVAELPAGPAGKGTVAFTSCYAVAAASPHQEAAIQLVNALSDRAGTETWTSLGYTMPARISLRTEWATRFPPMLPFLNGIDYAHVWQPPSGFDPVVQTVNRGIQQVFDGDAAPADVLMEAQQQAEETLHK